MRSLGTRRVVLTTGVAAATAFALAACSAGQVAETAIKKPSNAGVNADNSNRSVFIRNLSVQYPGTEGYEAGADAPLEFGIYNQTRSTITVLVSSQPAAAGSAEDGVVSARQVGLVGGTPATDASGGAVASVSPAPEPSGSRNSGGQDDQSEDEVPSPDASRGTVTDRSSAAPTASAAASAAARPAVGPARIELAPNGAATFLPGDATGLTALDLSGELGPGAALNLTFEFSNGAEPLVVQAPVSTPLTPASRAPGASDEHEGE